VAIDKNFDSSSEMLALGWLLFSSWNPTLHKLCFERDYEINARLFVLTNPNLGKGKKR
jgi:hypothetical protein